MMQHTNDSGCNLCSNRGRNRIRSQDTWNGEIVDIVRCSQCGLLYIHPFPSENALKQLYDSHYFNAVSPLHGGYENYQADEELIYKTFLERFNVFRKVTHYDGAGIALDVGCATGVFLEVLRDRGWRSKGIDISSYAVESARKKGLDVAPGSLEPTFSKAERYDLITLWDVIEHVRDPLSTLRLCQQRLKPNGYLLLSTPDASALLAKCLRTYWLGFRSAGEHLYFFGKESISKMIEKAGMNIVHIRSTGKHIRWDQVIRRCSYYSRIFRVFLPLQGRLLSKFSVYLNPGDTMFVIAQKKGQASASGGGRSKT